MARDGYRIGVVAPAGTVRADVPQSVQAIAAALYPDRTPEIHFHPQCFLSDGHFAGSDSARADAFVNVANDPSFDALWVGRGGYGACRIAEQVLPRLNAAARDKAYVGYSDAGVLLAALYGQGFGNVAHGPVAQDACRDGGAAAVERVLAWLLERSPAALEPSIDGARPTAAFNISILASLIGTPLQPDLTGHVLMLEEVSEYMYRIDRMLFQITSNAAIRKVAGLRLGRCSLTPENDPPFVRTEEEVARDWCVRSSIAYLGRADIGHDAGNKVVPFGLAEGR